jgi:hypothetical protein
MSPYGPFATLRACTATSVVRCNATARHGGGDHAGARALAYDDARRIAANITKLPTIAECPLSGEADIANR